MFFDAKTTSDMAAKRRQARLREEAVIDAILREKQRRYDAQANRYSHRGPPPKKGDGWRVALGALAVAGMIYGGHVLESHSWQNEKATVCSMTHSNVSAAQLATTDGIIATLNKSGEGHRLLIDGPLSMRPICADPSISVAAAVVPSTGQVIINPSFPAPVVIQQAVQALRSSEQAGFLANDYQVPLAKLSPREETTVERLGAADIAVSEVKVASELAAAGDPQVQQALPALGLGDLGDFYKLAGDVDARERDYLTLKLWFTQPARVEGATDQPVRAALDAARAQDPSGDRHYKSPAEFALESVTMRDNGGRETAGLVLYHDLDQFPVVDALANPAPANATAARRAPRPANGM